MIFYINDKYYNFYNGRKKKIIKIFGVKFCVYGCLFENIGIDVRVVSDGFCVFLIEEKFFCKGI